VHTYIRYTQVETGKVIQTDTDAHTHTCSQQKTEKKIRQMLHANPAWWRQTGAEQEHEVLLTAGAQQRQELFGGAQGVGNNAQLER
jgi:hypothetical protein